MSFVNEKNMLLTDELNNIHNIYWDNKKIYHSIFQKGKESKNVVVDEEVFLEFDAVLDKNNSLYVIYQKRNKEIVLAKNTKDGWSKDSLGNIDGFSVFNLKIFINKGYLNILYCTTEDEKENTYSIYHHYYEKEWKSKKVDNITRKILLNPFSLNTNEDKVRLFYYDMVGEFEEIFVKEFDYELYEWSEKNQLTSESNDKLCLDTLINGESLYLTYSKYVDENLIIKFEKFKLENYEKESEEEISNLGNPMYPTLVSDDKKLWGIWTEYDKVVSAYSTDKGNTWEGPYEWKETMKDRFYRYDYKTNNSGKYLLNHAFGKDYPNFSFLGFSNLEEATKVNVKKKDVITEEDDDTKAFLIVNDKDVKIIEDENEEYEKTILILQQEVDELKGKLKEMENKVPNVRKRRGFFFR